MLTQGFLPQELGTFTLFGPVGCEQCNSGYRDRAGIFEVMPLSESIAKIIVTGGNSTDIAEQAKQDGVWDLRRAGLEKVKQGLTSIEEINRVTLE